jgi:hypothetical protein
MNSVCSFKCAKPFKSFENIEYLKGIFSKYSIKQRRKMELEGLKKLGVRL